MFDTIGERGRNRTFNLLIKSQLLCQLSYAPSAAGQAAAVRRKGKNSTAVTLVGLQGARAQASFPSDSRSLNSGDIRACLSLPRRVTPSWSFE